MKYLTAVFILISPSVFSQQHNIPVVDSPAPKIELNTWARNPAYPFKSFKGKIVVLDFWFTSCAPCVFTIPHLNDLSDRYKNENVVFVAVTFEPKAVAERFLSGKQILANIGIDSAEHLIRKFGVKGYPKTFIIDEKGILRWEGYPGHLSATIIDGILGKTSKPEIIATVPTQSKSDFTKKIFPITVTKNSYMSHGSGFQSTAQEFSMVNGTLTTAISYLLQTSASRISIADTNKYDIRFVKPADIPYNKVGELTVESLLRELRYKIEYRNKPVAGYALSISNDSLLIKHAIDTARVRYYSLSSSSESWTGRGIAVPDLIRQLENEFSILIQDKTNLNANLNITLPSTSFDEARERLAFFGFTLTPAEFTVSILTVLPEKK